MRLATSDERLKLREDFVSQLGMALTPVKAPAEPDFFGMLADSPPEAVNVQVFKLETAQPMLAIPHPNGLTYAHKSLSRLRERDLGRGQKELGRKYN